MAIEADLVPDALWETPELERFAELVAAAERETMSAWLPIKSAPKDGTDVIVMYIHIDTQIVHNAFWIEDEADPEYTGWWSYDKSEVGRILLKDWMTPTGWMPLPKAPGTAT